MVRVSTWGRTEGSRGAEEAWVQRGGWSQLERKLLQPGAQAGPSHAPGLGCTVLFASCPGAPVCQNWSLEPQLYILPVPDSLASWPQCPPQ